MGWTDTTKGWEPEAKEWIKLNARSLPLADLCNQFNALADAGNWDQRTYQAIRQKVRRLGHTTNQQRRDAWPPEAREWLLENRRSYSRVAKLTEAYNQVAADNGWPQRSEQAISQQLSKRVKITVRLSRPVINIDTGDRYENAAQAGRAVYVDPESIRGAIKRGGLCADCRWAYADELEDRRA